MLPSRLAIIPQKSPLNERKLKVNTLLEAEVEGDGVEADGEGRGMSGGRREFVVDRALGVPRLDVALAGFAGRDVAV